MSLPSFPDKDKLPTREEAVNQIISSIAMEELGLSHIINAEGEKLQYALGTIPGVPGPEEPLTMDELLKLNDSIHRTLDSTMMNQFFLKEKLVNALTASVMQGPVGPVGTILGSYDTLEELEAAHPKGKQGDAYLVEGALYVWDVENSVWQNVGDLTGPQGPQGTGTTIKGSYETLEEFEENPPAGSLDDAYLVGGEIYIWNETDGWHSGGNLKGDKGDTGDAGEKGDKGDKGDVGTILGSYQTLDELEAAHPEGNQGDAYLVDGVLYVWDMDEEDWKGIGDLRGLVAGDTLFSIEVETDSEDVTFEETLTFTSDTLEITLEEGPIVNIEAPASHAGAIIPFASGATILIDTSVSGGTRNSCAILGFGHGIQMDLPIDLAASFTLGESTMDANHYAFPMPADGKITSIALTCSAYAPSGISGETNVVTARLYYCDTPDNVFKPIEGASVSVEVAGMFTGMTYQADINDTLSVELTAGTRLLFVVDTITPDYSNFTSVTAHWGGSIKIEG